MEIFVNGNPQIEVRGVGNEPKVLSGYAAVFDQRTAIGSFNEVVDRHAFDEFLDNPSDVVALFDHQGQPLGRMSNGTLKLSTDSHGLRYDLTPPDTALGRDILTLVKRGDISASSFAFFDVRSGGDEWDYSGSTPLRTLRNLNPHDVSPVTTPAYAMTSVQARSKIIVPPNEGIPDTNLERYYQEVYALRLRNADIRQMRYGN